MTIEDHAHGFVDFGVAGSTGPTLVLGGPWDHAHGQGRDLQGIRSLLVRQEGVRADWKSLNVEQLLRDLPNLTYVDIEVDFVDDLSWLNSVPNLEHFGLRCKKIRNSKVVLPPVIPRSLHLTGHDCLLKLVRGGVECLRVVGYRGRSLDDLIVPSLTTLEINRARMLEGIDAVRNSTAIKCIDIYSAPCLISISPALMGSVEYVRFSSCHSIKMPTQGVVNPHLKTLELVDCGDVGSLKILSNSFELERVQLSGTFVFDGAVEFLRQLPRLRDIRVQHQKNYDYKFDI